MGEKRRKGILIVVGIWIVIMILAAAAYKLLIRPDLEADLVEATGSESQYKHEVVLAADAFSGYAVLRSRAMRSQLKAFGIKLEVKDDQADYIGRLEALDAGDTQMAVFTVDALLTAGAALGRFPATIVMVIDETTGADAIVSYRDGLGSLQALDNPDARIVATPASPSEFLARTVIATLSLPSLPEKWLIKGDGAADVYQRFRAASAAERKYAYVLWEPYVSKALKEPEAQVLLDSSKMKGYIVDVLVAQRRFLTEQPELVRQVVESYARAAYSYAQQDGGMVRLVMADAKAAGEPLSAEEAKKLVAGIRWKNTLESYAHLGVVPTASAKGAQSLEDIITKIADVLVRTGALANNPVEGKAHTLFYKGTLAQLHAGGFHPGKKLAILEGVGPGSDELAPVRADVELPALTDAQWEKLSTVGAMRVESITFRRGTSEISELGQSELDALAKRFSSWPMYYLRIVGHARAEGDARANLKLATARARATRDYLIARGIAPQRLRSEGAKPKKGTLAASEVSFVLGQNPF